MNDFTKEELKIIRMLINSTDEKVLTKSEEIIIVQSKIQSMIDNFDAQVIEVWHCEKCGHVQ